MAYFSLRVIELVGRNVCFFLSYLSRTNRATFHGICNLSGGKVIMISCTIKKNDMSKFSLEAKVVFAID